MATRVTTEPVLDRRGNALSGLELDVKIDATGASATLYTAKTGGSSVSGTGLTTNQDGYPAQPGDEDPLYWEVGSYRYEIDGLDVRDGPAIRYPEAVSGSDAVLSQAGLVMLAPTTDERNIIAAPTSSIVPLTLRGAVGQTDDLFRIDHESGEEAIVVQAGNATIEQHQRTGYVGAPEHKFIPIPSVPNASYGWTEGIDVAAPIANRDYVVAAKNLASGVEDFIYCSHNGADGPTVRIGGAQPGTFARVNITPDPGLDAQHALRIYQSSGRAGKAILYRDSGDVDRFSVGPLGIVEQTGGLRVIKSGALTTDAFLYSRATADSQPYFEALMGGTLKWGPGGSTATDSELKRNGVGLLQLTNTAIQAVRTTSSDAALIAMVTGDTQHRLRIRGDGYMFWGSGSASPAEALGRAGTGLLEFTGADVRTNSGYFRWVAANEQTTVGAAGGASALPATPTMYLKVKNNAGTVLVVPAYAAA